MCNAILEEIESLMDANAEVIAKKINLLQAIQFWRDAWDSVSKEAIQNCWKKAQLKEWQGMTSEFVDDEITTCDCLKYSSKCTEYQIYKMQSLPKPLAL